MRHGLFIALAAASTLPPGAALAEPGTPIYLACTREDGQRQQPLVLQVKKKIATVFLDRSAAISASAPGIPLSFDLPLIETATTLGYHTESIFGDSTMRVDRYSLQYEFEFRLGKDVMFTRGQCFRESPKF